MNLKILLTMVVASLLIGTLCMGVVPVAAQDTTTGVSGLGDLSGIVQTLVDAIDDIFGIFVSSPKLNQMLRNLSAALAVLVQHSMNELFSAIYFSLYMGIVFLPIFPFVVIATFIVIGSIGVLRAIIDAFATFTRPY